jgi:esterase/lipase
VNDGGSRPTNGNGGGNSGGGASGGGNRDGGRLRGTGREPGRISRVPSGGGQGRGPGSGSGGGPGGGSGRRSGPPPYRPHVVPGPIAAPSQPQGYAAPGAPGGMPPRPGGPTAPDPMPSDPVVTPEAQALALTAWDLARTRGDREDTPRGQIMTLRTHQKLIAAFESGRHIPEEDRTFLRVRENARGSFLLIHGMSTGPADLRGLARHLGDNECNVWVMRLPELGATPGSVNHASWESSLMQATQRCKMLSRGGGNLHVVGLGYGAALALHLASLESVSSLVLLAPALMPKVSVFQRQIVRLRLHRLSFFRRLLGLNADLMEGMDTARGRVGRVRVPIYAAQCDDDDRASPESLRFLQRKANNRESRFQVFPTGGHAILAAHGERALYGEILKFCGIR